MEITCRCASCTSAGYRRHAGVAGFNGSVLMDEAELLDDPLVADTRFAAAFELLRRSGAARAPYCGAYKPLAIWRALSDACEGDYVLWADAQKAHSKQALEWARDAAPTPALCDRLQALLDRELKRGAIATALAVRLGPDPLNRRKRAISIEPRSSS